MNWQNYVVSGGFSYTPWIALGFLFLFLWDFMIA